MNEFSTIIIGGGMAGLTCARYLNDKGLSFLILESSDALGGRVRTDKVDGFRLDRGFQVLQTNYAEARKILNYNQLDLRYFNPGALIKTRKGLVKVDNPFKGKPSLLSFLTSSIGTLRDKRRIRKIAKEAAEIPDSAIFREGDTDTAQLLQDYGFSERIITDFFKPFFGGLFFENELSSSGNFFRFVLKQLFRGEAAIPVDGMQAIPEQVAEKIPANSVRLNTHVKHIEGNKVFLEGAEPIEAEKIVIATDASSADHLLGERSNYQYQVNTCTYFSAEYSPLKGQKFIVLNPERRGLIHNLCVPTDIVPVYGPAGKALISVSTQGLKNLDKRNHAGRIKRELYDWFGSPVNGWKHLRTYHIPEAVVKFPAGTKKKILKLGENLYRCGDYTAYPSINAAMETGREVAEIISEV